jgi:hypothetical protein
LYSWYDYLQTIRIIADTQGSKVIYLCYVGSTEDAKYGQKVQFRAASNIVQM